MRSYFLLVALLGAGLAQAGSFPVAANRGLLQAEAAPTCPSQTCPSNTRPSTCTENACRNCQYTCSCKADTRDQICEAAKADDVDCGDITRDDGCGILTPYNCGTCPGATDRCQSNKCCTPLTDLQICAKAEADCGMVTMDDGCLEEREVDCSKISTSPCKSWETCSTSNKCECIRPADSTFCEAAGGANCGEVPATICGVETNVTCGTCKATTEFCDANQKCACKNESDEELCAAAGLTGTECGIIDVTDRCGKARSVDCTDLGLDCAAGQTCEAGTPNTCCTEPTQEAVCSNKCGKVTVNKCGKDYEFTCPGCKDGEQCNAETSQCDFIPLEPCLSTCTVSGVSGTCSATNQTGPLLSCVLPLDGQGCSAGEHCPLKWCCVAQDKLCPPASNKLGCVCVNKASNGAKCPAGWTSGGCSENTCNAFFRNYDASYGSCCVPPSTGGGSGRRLFQLA